jgi:hypothetical protein
MTRAAIVFVLAALAVALTAGPASADDQGVYDAFVSQDVKVDRLGKQFRHGLRVWERSHYKRDGLALRPLDKVIVALTQVDRSVSGQEPSSDHGRAAKSAALATVRLLGRSTVALRRGIVALTNGHPRRALRHSRVAKRLVKRVKPAERRARREFKAAGITVAPDAGP